MTCVRWLRLPNPIAAVVPTGECLVVANAEPGADAVLCAAAAAEAVDVGADDGSAAAAAAAGRAAVLWFALDCMSCASVCADFVLLLCVRLCVVLSWSAGLCVCVRRRVC